MSNQDGKVKDTKSETANQQLIDFSETWSFGDVCFLVEDKSLWANKAALGMWSPVFRAMFSGNFQERDSTAIPLPGKSYESFHELLCVTHPPNKAITGAIALTIVPLVHEYQMDVLTERCDEVLCKEPLSIHLFLIAQRFGLQKLGLSALKYLKTEPMSRLLIQTESWEELTPKFKLGLLTRRCLNYEKHNHLACGGCYCCGIN